MFRPFLHFCCVCLLKSGVILFCMDNPRKYPLEFQKLDRRTNFLVDHCNSFSVFISKGMEQLFIKAGDKKLECLAALCHTLLHPQHVSSLYKFIFTYLQSLAITFTLPSQMSFFGILLRFIFTCLSMLPSQTRCNLFQFTCTELARGGGGQFNTGGSCHGQTDNQMDNIKE